MPVVEEQPWRFRRLSDRSAALGEGPVWSADGNCVWWVDIEGGRLLCSDAASGATESWRAPGPIACLALLPDGDLLAGIGTALCRFDRRRGAFVPLGELDDSEQVRFNDAALDPAGRLWAGTMDRDNRAPLGALFRIGADLVPVRVLDGLLTPNGLAFDDVRGRLYLSDSHPSVQTVWCCDYDAASGELGERRIFAHFKDLPGRPDGAAVDAEGNYWIAAIGGAALLCFAPSGSLLERIPLAVSAPTKPVFGGPGLDRLFLTSRRVEPAAATPALDGDSGFLLAARAVAGRPQPRFAQAK